MAYNKNDRIIEKELMKADKEYMKAEKKYGKGRTRSAERHENKAMSHELRAENLSAAAAQNTTDAARVASYHGIGGIYPASSTSVFPSTGYVNTITTVPATTNIIETPIGNMITATSTNMGLPSDYPSVNAFPTASIIPNAGATMVGRSAPSTYNSSISTTLTSFNVAPSSYTTTSSSSSTPYYTCAVPSTPNTVETLASATSTTRHEYTTTTIPETGVCSSTVNEMYYTPATIVSTAQAAPLSSNICDRLY